MQIAVSRMPAKGVSKGDEEGVAELREDDPLPERIDLACKGTVACDVRSLTSCWPDAINRDIDEQHVQHLKEIFIVGLHRQLPEHRLKISVSREEWTSLLAFLVGGMQEGRLPPPVMDHEITQETLQEIIAKQGFGLHMGDTSSGVFLPKDLPITPVLEAGQHRREALLQLLEDETCLAKTSGGKDKRVTEARDIVSAFYTCQNSILFYK